MCNTIKIDLPINLLWGDASINQHYVFQAYLRRFAIDKENKIIWANIDDKIIKDVPIKSIAFLPKMYEAKLLSNNEIAFFKLVVKIINHNNVNLYKRAEEFIYNYNKPAVLNANGKIFCDKLLEETDKSYCDDLKNWIEKFEENNKVNLVNMNEKYYCEMETELNKFIDDIIKLNFQKIKKSRKKIIRDINYQYFRTKVMRDRTKCVFVAILQNERLCYDFSVNCNDVDVDKILTPFQIFLPMIFNPDFYKSNITILKNDTDVGFITCDQPIINLYHDYKANNITDKTKYYYPISPKIAIIMEKKI